MKYILLLAVFSALLGNRCSSVKSKTADSSTKDSINKAQTDSIASVPVTAKDSVPSCVRKMIGESGKDNPPTLPIQVDEYLYKGRTVYAFTADCCDQFNMVYDDSCHAICAPSGGFTGKGDGKCPDFSKDAKFIKLIWKNPAK